MENNGIASKRLKTVKNKSKKQSYLSQMAPSFTPIAISLVASVISCLDAYAKATFRTDLMQIIKGNTRCMVR